MVEIVHTRRNRPVHTRRHQQPWMRIQKMPDCSLHISVGTAKNLRCITVLGTFGLMQAASVINLRSIKFEDDGYRRS
jgi:hypothetical protein